LAVFQEKNEKRHEAIGHQAREKDFNARGAKDARGAKILDMNTVFECKSGYAVVAGGRDEVYTVLRRAWPE